ncbi:DUF2281 domain-containing protein [Aerosakkonemataceae cyanobacterium BLCC-F154]|uniref:DUF2281 domain-containing protein n=1 Tax=Floridaenema fluviatile BLCC-F154 TaxID=3153640 RepID=A0ABV4YEZ9_9CYAN
MTIRDSAIAKLQQLPEPLLQEVSDFIDFITQKHLAKTAESQSKEKLVEAWLKWFESVDQLEVTTAEPSNKQLRPFGLCAGEFTVPDDFDAPNSKENDWWLKVAGSFENDSTFDEAIRLGQEWRKSAE